MNYYYDPILGLQYDNLGVSIVLDIENIPKDLGIEEAVNNFLKGFYKSGISLYGGYIFSTINFRG